MGSSPVAVRFHFADETGTFSNVNSFVSFAAARPDVPVLLGENSVLRSRFRGSTERIVEFAAGRLGDSENARLLNREFGVRTTWRGQTRGSAYRDSAELLAPERHVMHRAFLAGFRFASEPVAKANRLRRSVGLDQALGVHVRFTDLYTPKPDYPDLIASYEESIDAVLDKCVSRLFLATHLQPVSDHFRRRYGKRLVEWEQYRNPDPDSDWHGNKPIDRECEDVLIDMLLLASCKCILGGPSQVTFAALWYDPTLPIITPSILQHVDCR